MRIKLLGLEGCGCNFVEYFVKTSSLPIETYGINVDISVLLRRNLPKRAYLELNRGWIFDAKKGRWFFYEDSNSFYRYLLSDARWLILVYGSGGRTGSQLALNISKLAKQRDIFTVHIAILLFSFEGSRKTKTSQNAISEIVNYVDIFYLLKNDDLLKLVPPNLKIGEIFEIIDRKITKFVEIMLNSEILDNDKKN